MLVPAGSGFVEVGETERGSVRVPIEPLQYLAHRGGSYETDAELTPDEAEAFASAIVEAARKAREVQARPLAVWCQAKGCTFRVHKGERFCAAHLHAMARHAVALRTSPQTDDASGGGLAP